MKIILDTNIWISGIHWNGESFKIIQSWKNHKFELIISWEIISELIRILSDFKIKMEENELSFWINSILINSELVEPKQKLNIVKEDPNDNMFLEAAEESNADYIITQDNHLLKLRSYKTAKILTPKEFISILNHK